MQPCNTCAASASQVVEVKALLVAATLATADAQQKAAQNVSAAVAAAGDREAALALAASKLLSDRANSGYRRRAELAEEAAAKAEREVALAISKANRAESEAIRTTRSVKAMVRALKADVAAAKAESAAFEQKTRTATHEALQATSDATAKTQRAHKMTAAVKAQLKTLEASAAAATAAVEERLKDQAQCTASALLAASDVAKCQMAERDLWHAARDTFLERLLSEWRVSSRQIMAVDVFTSWRSAAVRTSCRRAQLAAGEAMRQCSHAQAAASAAQVSATGAGIQLKPLSRWLDNHNRTMRKLKTWEMWHQSIAEADRAGKVAQTLEEPVSTVDQSLSRSGFAAHGSPVRADAKTAMEAAPRVTRQSARLVAQARPVAADAASSRSRDLKANLQPSVSASVVKKGAVFSDRRSHGMTKRSAAPSNSGIVAVQYMYEPPVQMPADKSGHAVRVPVAKPAGWGVVIAETRRHSSPGSHRDNLISGTSSPRFPVLSCGANLSFSVDSESTKEAQRHSMTAAVSRSAQQARDLRPRNITVRMQQPVLGCPAKAVSDASDPDSANDDQTLRLDQAQSTARTAHTAVRIHIGQPDISPVSVRREVKFSRLC